MNFPSGKNKKGRFTRSGLANTPQRAAGSVIAVQVQHAAHRAGQQVGGPAEEVDVAGTRVQTRAEQWRIGGGAAGAGEGGKPCSAGVRPDGAGAFLADGVSGNGTEPH